MMPSLADLLATKTRDQLVSEILSALSGARLPVTAWQEGGVARSLVKADATALADLYASVVLVAKGGFLSESSGAWLTLLAKSRFDLDRLPATFAAGQMVLAAAGGTGPYAIAPGGLLVTDGAVRWRSTNAASVSVPSGGTATINVRAESPGTAYNLGSGATLAIVSPAYAGLSVTNPVIAGTSTWQTVSGQPEETDDELRLRCLARWSALGRGASIDSYVYLALNCPDAPAIRKARVVPGTGDGKVGVYISHAGGAATGGEVAAVQTWLDAQKPVTDDVSVYAASVTNVTVGGTVRVRNATYNTAENRFKARDAVEAYFQTLEMGDAVDLGGIYAGLRSADGVVDVDLSAPTGDVSIPGTGIAVLDYQITSGDWGV